MDKRNTRGWQKKYKGMTKEVQGDGQKKYKGLAKEKKRGWT